MNKVVSLALWRWLHAIPAVPDKRWVWACSCGCRDHVLNYGGTIECSDCGALGRRQHFDPGEHGDAG